MASRPPESHTIVSSLSSPNKAPLKLAKLFQCLGDKTRLRILNLLFERPLCVCHLQDILDASQVKISKHLKLLRERGIIHRSRFQNWSVYHLADNLSPEQKSCLEAVRVCTQGEPTFSTDSARLAELPIDCYPYERIRKVFPKLYAATPSSSRARRT